MHLSCFYDTNHTFIRGGETFLIALYYNVLHGDIVQIQRHKLSLLVSKSWDVDPAILCSYNICCQSLCSSHCEDKQ